VFAQALDIVDQVWCGVIAQLAERRRAPCAALVKNDDPVMCGIEKAAVIGRGSGPGPAVQEYHWHALRVAGLFPIHGVGAIEREHAGAVGLELRIKFGAYAGRNVHCCARECSVGPVKIA
jgi:hypothetical protein